MLDILAQIDILGLGALVGSLVFLGGLVWLLLDDRPLERLNDRHAADDEQPDRPPRPRRAA